MITKKFKVDIKTKKKILSYLLERENPDEGGELNGNASLLGVCEPMGAVPVYRYYLYNDCGLVFYCQNITIHKKDGNVGEVFSELKKSSENY